MTQLSQTIEIWIPGEPKPGGSKRGFVNKKTGKVIITEDNAKTADWRSMVAFAVAKAIPKPLLGAIQIELVFHMPRSKTHFKHGTNELRKAAPMLHTKRPDTTKLIRSTEDALKGIAWLDDSQIVSQTAHKCYDPTPGCRLTITALEIQPEDGSAKTTLFDLWDDL